MDTTDFQGITAAQLRHAYALTAIKSLSALEESRRTLTSRDEIMRRRWPGAIGADLVTKATGAISTSTVTVTPGGLTEAFFKEAEAGSILGRLTSPRLGAFVPALDSVEDNTFAWIGEGKPAPLPAVSLDAVTGLSPLPMGGIVAVTRELLKLSSPGAVEYVRALLAARHVKFLDQSLIDPTSTAVANTRPDAITANATPVTSAGSEAADMVEDARALLRSFDANGGRLEQAVAIMSPAVAVALKTSGAMAFAGLTKDGGDYGGIPAITSAAAGAHIVLLDQAGLVVYDSGAGDLDVSGEADLEMLPSALQQNGVTGAGASMVSLWQSGLVGVRIMRQLNWRLLYDGAVQYIASVPYAAAGSPA